MASKYLSKDRMKICNICGEDVLVYTVVDNAPICKGCLPVPSKKLMNEKKMFENILKRKDS